MDPAREALRLLDEEPALDEELLKLGRWIAAYYCAPLGETLRAMTPLAGDIRRGKIYSLTKSGRDAARQFFGAVAGRHRRIARTVPTRANGHAAWADYRPDPATGLLRLASIEVAVVAGGSITELTRFEPAVAPWFGLPGTLAP